MHDVPLLQRPSKMHISRIGLLDLLQHFYPSATAFGLACPPIERLKTPGRRRGWSSFWGPWTPTSKQGESSQITRITVELLRLHLALHGTCIMFSSRYPGEWLYPGVGWFPGTCLASKDDTGGSWLAWPRGPAGRTALVIRSAAKARKHVCFFNRQAATVKTCPSRISSMMHSVLEASRLYIIMYYYWYKLKCIS